MSEARTVEEAFKQFDADKSGQVSFAEFGKAVERFGLTVAEGGKGGAGSAAWAKVPSFAAATRRSSGPPVCSGWPSGPESRALADRMPRQACSTVRALAPAPSR